MPKPRTGIDYVEQLLELVQPPSPVPAVLPAPMDEEAISRILADVGSEITPPTIEKYSLLQAVAKANETRRRIDQLRPGARRRAILMSLGRTVEAAESLAEALKANADAVELLAEKVPNALEELVKLVDAAKEIREKLIQSGIASEAAKKRIPSATEWMAGVELPLIFEKYFDRPAGRARNNGKPGGPMVRFIAAVFRELGIDVEDETVLRAISRFADIRQHRRAVRQRS